MLATFVIIIYVSAREFNPDRHTDTTPPTDAERQSFAPSYTTTSDDDGDDDDDIDDDMDI
ncbi:hypothetical protein HK102_006251 [Quaeritorhiza haematococci]|nr:hypothetical protein HK102_006251 [Quaeritorhiza haematococci]